VVFVADQHDDRALGAVGLLERGGDARRIGVALDQVVVEPDRW